MKNKRYYFLYGVLIVFCAAIVIRLCDVQIVNGEAYKEESLKRLYKTVTVQAPGAEIFDCLGRPLVANRMGFSITIQKQKGMTDEDVNRVLFHILNLFGKRG